MSETYSKLAAPFERIHKDPRGFDYLSGEQVVSRLNEVLGPGGWNFVVKDHGYNEEADEMWALGRLEACIDGSMVWREQFGSQKHNRSRKDGKVLDYGFDAKGAATDALKKCATLIGVGLYLSEKDGGVPQEPERQARAAASVAPVSVSYTATDIREVGDNPDILRSADDPLWKRWLHVLSEAQSLGVKVQIVKLPMHRGDLAAYGKEIADQVAERKRSLADQDAKVAAAR